MTVIRQGRDRPKNPVERKWRVIYKDGSEVIVHAEYRAMARHYAKSYRNDYVGSFQNYIDIISVRLIK